MMRLFFITIFICNALFITTMYSQTTSLNSDFELGNLTGWSASNGKRNKTTGEITFTNNSITANREVIINKLFNDRNTCGELPSLPADGGNYVARLGNNVKGAQAEQLRYSITVNENNALFIYKYAVVFEDPGHTDIEQPFFEVAVRDNYGKIIDSLCGYNQIISGGSILGFNRCILYDNVDDSKDTVVMWKPWTTVAMDLTPYMGQTIMLEFTNADCSLGGHWAYSYMEARTEAMKIQVKACESDSIAYLRAPEGFSSYTWNNGLTTKEIAVRLVEGAIYNCVMTSIPGCSVTLQATVEIKKVSVSPPNITICKGEPANLKASGADYYEWDNDLGTGADKVVYPLVSTTYSVKGVTIDGCVDTGSSIVTVLEAPQLEITVNTPCEGNPLMFTANTSTFISYDWNGPLFFTSSNQNPTIPSANIEMAGTYSVTATSNNGCKISKNIVATILPKPQIITTNTNACENGEIFLRAFPSGLQSYQWDGPGGFSSNQQFVNITSVTQSMSGVYSVIATNAQNCKDTAQIQLQVYPSPVADFSNTIPCAGESMHFINNTSGATTWEWDFGNGIYSQSQQPSDVIYSYAREYSVTLIVFNNYSCSDSIQKIVKPFAVPIAQFATDKACIGDNYTLKDLSYVQNDAIVSWNWDFGSQGTSTLQNPTIQLVNSNPIPVKLTVSTSHCSNSQLHNILSYPKPVLSPFQPNGCSPLEVQFPQQTIEERVFHVWDFDDGTSTPESNPTHFFFNQTGIPKNFNVKHIVTTEFGCTDSIISTVNVYPEPITDFTLSKNKICSGETVLFTNLSQFADTFIWDLGNGITSTNSNPSQTYINTTNNVIYIPITLKTISEYNCEDSLTRFISVYPFPDKGIELSDTAGCSPFIPELSTQSVAPYYEWNYGDGSFDLGSNVVEHIYVNETNALIVRPITLKVSTNQGCEAIFQSTVYIYPSPVANFTIDTNIACSPFRANFMNTSQGATNFTWNFDSQTNVHNGEQSFAHLFENKTSTQESHRIEIAVENSFGCNDYHALSINVFPEVVAQFISTPIEGCSPLNTNFENTSIGADSYFWIYGDNTHSSNLHSKHTYVNITENIQLYNTQLIAISAYNCRDTSDITTIKVFPEPLAQFDVNKISGCSPLSISFQNNSQRAISYNWIYGGTTSTAFTIPNQIVSNIDSVVKVETFTLVAQNQYACTDSASQPITIFPEVFANFIPNTSGCSPLPITFTNQSKNASLFIWDFDDGKRSTVKNATNTFINESNHDTIFHVTLSAESHLGCKAQLSKNIQVFPPVYAQFNVQTQVSCSPLSTQITNTSNDAIYFEWKIDTISQQHIGEQSFDFYSENTTVSQKTHIIELFVRNQFFCSDTYVQALNVYPKVTANFITSPLQGCSPLQVNFENISGNANTFSWTFGDNTLSSNKNTQHTYVNSSDSIQQFNVQLIANSAFNCADTSEFQTIEVYPQPLAQFSMDTISGCSPLQVTIQDKSEGVNHYSWNYGNGISSESFIPTHEYSNFGNSVETISISLIGYNEYMCSDSSNQPITVFPQVIPNFALTGTGCSPLEINFSNFSQNADVYVWDFGDGKKATIKEPVNTYINNTLQDSTFHITLSTASYLGCKASISKNVTVYATPNPTFLPSASHVILPYAEVDFENLTEGEWTYVWNFGDGTLSSLEQPTTHTYTTPGTLPVILEAQSTHCRDTVIQYIVISGAEIVADYDSSFVGCEPLEVQFTNKSINALEYKWNFGDGTSSTEKNPLHVYTKPGNYVVELTAKNNDLVAVSRAHTVTVYKNPKAEFIIAPTIVYLPNAEISTYNQSTDAEQVTWYFGDGTISFEFQPQHIYQETGQYDIALTVESRDGCKDSLFKQKAVTVLLDCNLKFPNAFTPSGNKGDGFYDISIPEATNNVFHPIFKNIEAYNLQIFNRWGEIVYESNELDRGWDGYYKDEISKSDVYVWKCEASCIGGKNISLIGNVTLIR